MCNASSIVREIIAGEQDFEWYPTTDEILDVIKTDIYGDEIGCGIDSPSILDCGAGDGRALQYLTNGKKYAIEKSQILIEKQPNDIFVIGTDFYNQVLIDKKVDVIFCNPPYSNFSEWMRKIIHEGNAKHCYFIVPIRWNGDASIHEVIKQREAEVSVLGEFDFLNADRSARAKVQIIRVDFCYGRYRNHFKVNPFDLWFKNHFHIEIAETKQSKFSWKERVSENIASEIVKGADTIQILERLYQNDLKNLIGQYKRIEEIGPDLLEELGVNQKGLKEALKIKIEGLKDLYWSELFGNLGNITSRLTHQSREKMLDQLTSHTHIDFTCENAYAILIWVLKNANQYFDSQLIDFVEKTSERSCIKLYKSNERTFGEEDWRWGSKPENLECYYLDLRIILHRIGGMNSGYLGSWEINQLKNLSQSAFHYINDALTIANNLGFDTTRSKRAGDFEWEAGSKVDLHYFDHRSQEEVVLMTVRAFMNGNLHIKFNQAFLRRLNIEFGRLKGWIKDWSQSVDEMEISLEEAREAWACNLKIEVTNVKQILFQEAA